MKRASALLVIAIFLFASIYTVAGAAKKGFGNTVFNFEKTEKSLAESVPFRDEIIALMTKIRFVSGVRSFGDIIIGSDGSLLKDMEKPQTALYKSACAYIEEFAKQAEPDVYLMLVPTASVIRQQEVSAYTAAGFFNQRHYINEIYETIYGSVRTVDVYQTLFNRRNEYIYYHTEDLPTGLGGYYIYDSIAERLGITPKSLSDFSVAYVRQNFYGSLATQIIREYSAPDFVSLYEEGSGKGGKTVAHYYPDKSEDLLDGLYARDENFPDATDTVFGGIAAVTEITDDLQEGKSLLVFCDDTAKSWVPFMTGHYQKITLVRLSEASEEQLSAINAESYDQIVFAYSTANFAEEDFSKLIGR